MNKLDLVKTLISLRKHWDIQDFKDAYSDEWKNIPTKIGDCFEMMEEYLNATYDISYLEEVIKDELTDFKDRYNAKIQIILDEQDAKLTPLYREYIQRNKHKLKGVQFTTGEGDDMYEIISVEEDALILVQTWEEGEEVEIEDLSFNQLQEIYDNLTLK